MEEIIINSKNNLLLFIFLLISALAIIVFFTTLFLMSYNKYLRAFLTNNGESIPLHISNNNHGNRYTQNNIPQFDRILQTSDSIIENVTLPIGITISQYVNVLFLLFITINSSFSINFNITSNFLNLDQFGFIFFLSFGINFPKGPFRTLNIRQILFLWFFIASVCNLLTCVANIIYQFFSQNSLTYIYLSDSASIFISLYIFIFTILSLHSYYKYRAIT